MIVRALCLWAAVVAPAAATAPPKELPTPVDVSVSGIVLTEPQTTVAVLGQGIKWQETEAALPHATFLNADLTEQLTVTVHNGDYANSVSEVRVEARKNQAKPLKKIKHFITGKGVRRGISEAELIALLGKPTSKAGATLHYEITNFEDSSFLKHYGMPAYYGNYTFKDGKLEEYAFGFEYP